MKKIIKKNRKDTVTGIFAYVFFTEIMIFDPTIFKDFFSLNSKFGYWWDFFWQDDPDPKLWLCDDATWGILLHGKMVKQTFIRQTKIQKGLYNKDMMKDLLSGPFNISDLYHYGILEWSWSHNSNLEIRYGLLSIYRMSVCSCPRPIGYIVQYETNLRANEKKQCFSPNRLVEWESWVFDLDILRIFSHIFGDF